MTLRGIENLRFPLELEVRRVLYDELRSHAMRLEASVTRELTKHTTESEAKVRNFEEVVTLRDEVAP